MSYATNKLKNKKSPPPDNNLYRFFMLAFAMRAFNAIKNSKKENRK